VGSFVGLGVGIIEGLKLGKEVVGNCDGAGLGTADGIRLGEGEGTADGC
jgi:hypothetical protein